MGRDKRERDGGEGGGEREREREEAARLRQGPRSPGGKGVLSPFTPPSRSLCHSHARGESEASERGLGLGTADPKRDHVREGFGFGQTQGRHRLLRGAPKEVREGAD